MSRKTYIGCSLVQAEPMTLGSYDAYRGCSTPPTHHGQSGYLIVYPDGSESWSPSETFDNSHFHIENESSIGLLDVQRFIKKTESISFEKTTIVKSTLANGFEILESSSCVDPANYSRQVGEKNCESLICNKAWAFLGFLLQSARCGFRFATPLAKQGKNTFAMADAAPRMLSVLDKIANTESFEYFEAEAVFKLASRDSEQKASPIYHSAP